MPTAELSSPSLNPSARKFTRRASIVALGAGVTSAAWAFGIEPNALSITEKSLTIKDWPSTLDNFSIAHLTDLHFRPGADEEVTEKLISAVNKARVDLILITGDFVIADSSSLPECARYLKKLTAKHGLIASPGNHDRWHCAPSEIRHHLRKAGIDYLQNDGATISVKGEQFYLAGLDSIWGGDLDSARAWRGHRKGDAVITLMHEPDPFDHLISTRPVSLQLSGHTHGGQCCVPLIGYAPARVKFGRNYLYGHYEKNGSQLWVGRGVGTVGFRARFACRPELTFLTLRASS